MRKLKALTFLELVFAMAVIFVGATAVTSLLIAGAGWPKRTQQSNYRDSLAHREMTRIIDSGLPPTAAAFAPIPGDIRFESQVTVQPASFASNVSVVEVTVRGPLPDSQPLSTSLRSVYTKPDPVQLFNEYKCFTCHNFPGAVGVQPMPAGTLPPLAGPDLTKVNLQAGMAQANADRAAQSPPLPPLTSSDAYLENAIRFPNDSLVPGYTGTSLMDTFKDVTAMPQSDLEALKAFVRTTTGF